MYKLHNLFRSIRVSNENSSVTKAFHFLNLFQLQNFCAFSMHHLKPRHQLSTLSSFICYFSCIYSFVLSKMTLKLKSTTKWSLKRLKLGMVSSFHPHSMCKRAERVMAKTGRTSCTNWTISFEVSGFRTRTHLLHGHFIFLNLLQQQTFFAFRTHHSKRRHQFSTLSDIICYFSVIYRFF